MILPRFTLAEPESISHACELLRQDEKARVIAGGTDLLVNMKRGVTSAGLLISLDKISELHTMQMPGRANLAIGPMVTVAEVASSGLVMADFPVLANAAGKLGSMQIRNRATIGGNVCTARPAGDTIGPLVAYGASARISNGSSERTETFERLYKGPGQTTVKHDEVLTSIMLKKPAPHTTGSYIKYTIRNAMEIALVSVTTLLTMDGDICRNARVVLGAVAPTFVRCEVTEGFLVGKKVTPEVAAAAGKLVIDACSPITDLRATADYRRDLVQKLVERSILESASGMAG
jgi:aerobic carbon-monoxide dehydrogenase medium subunit